MQTTDRCTDAKIYAQKEGTREGEQKAKSTDEQKAGTRAEDRWMVGHLMFLLQQSAPHALLQLSQGQDDLCLVNCHATLFWHKVTEQGIIKAIHAATCSTPERFKKVLMKDTCIKKTKQTKKTNKVNKGRNTSNISTNSS